MLRELTRLVACDTSLPPGENYGALCDLVEEIFAPLECSSERVVVPEDLWSAAGLRGERINLILRPDMGGPNLPEALIYFHTDTAAIGDGWTHPPLDVTLDGEKVFGRGTADMKGTIVAVCDALLQLRGKPLAFRPVLAFCTDEEGGRHPGIRYLAETRTLPDVLLNLNGPAEPRIWAGCMGSLNFQLRIQGKSAHSGEPERGINAIDLALPAIEALRTLAQQVKTRVANMPPPPWSDGPIHAKLTLTAIHAGSGGSAIPGQCDIVINRRYTPDETAEAAEREIQSAIAGVLDDGIWTLETIGHLPPVGNPDGPATDRWTAARAKAFGLTPNDFIRYGSGTSSDFGWVQKAGQRHMLLGGLARPERNVHGPDEHTTLSDLNELSRAVELFLSAGFAPESFDKPAATGTSGTTPTEETAK
ncbi:M20 family metallopeptidase [Oceaniovalibus sp. ACAM 378]|uniref:M20 family metallopeptidase n=1 Tax=Oceaniovalibus sp. ACAM 378 TaxID=2599923 RepID=UPI0016522BF0|nr:M20/M25/M40 family metallo-hydrolase [Oceaniovalibus sp. ACAM 378]